jgi:hypothetical protein
MGHFSYYERIPQTTGVRGRTIRIVRRILRRMLWPILLNQEVRFQKVYDSLQALRAEQSRLDGLACMHLALRRRLDFMERALAELESSKHREHGSRSNSDLPRTRCA